MKKKVILSLIIIIPQILALAYYLPRTKYIELVGTEVKRNQSKKNKVVDRRFVMAREIVDGDTVVFRNEDIFWPPYFKFDSGTLSGKVMNWQSDNKERKIKATFYGWRIPIFSMYPNLTSLEQVKNYKQIIPWFNVFAILLLTICNVLIVYYLTKKVSPKIKKVKRNVFN